ncbi:MAG TPA: SufS family cysteine desulfurase [Erysipelothrix sp.]|jgi:cysteine desulfurase/selenocysteine lyase|nr:SufS family cysteine desulfurase [Erysipelothrix sp.]
MFDVAKIRQDFPVLKRMMEDKPLIYFDNAATTFKPQAVIDAVTNYYVNESVNIHRGDYALSHDVSNHFDNVRKQVADFIGASQKEIVFTSGASEALNIVANGYGMKYLKEGDVILTTEAEHASNILPWFNVAKKTGAIVEYIPMDSEGRLTIEDVQSVLHNRVKVIVIAHVSNVLGYVNPMKEISQLAHEIGAIVVCDGAQSVAHMPIDVKNLDVDFFGFSAHKMCGPTGVGVLYGKYELLEMSDPLLYGGGSNARFNTCGDVLLKHSPDKYESGTRNIEGVLGFGAAIEYLDSIGMEKIAEIERELHQYLMSKLKELDNLIIYNPEADTAITAFNVKGIFAQDVAAYLSTFGIACRAGNHCAKILLEVLGTNETLRCSLYFYNTKEEIDTFVDVLKDITLEKTIDMYL